MANSYQDKVLGGDGVARYTLRKRDGTIMGEDVEFIMSTPVETEGDRFGSKEVNQLLVKENGEPISIASMTKADKSTSGIFSPRLYIGGNFIKYLNNGYYRKFDKLVTFCLNTGIITLNEGGSFRISGLPYPIDASLENATSIVSFYGRQLINFVYEGGSTRLGAHELYLYIGTDNSIKVDSIDYATPYNVIVPSAAGTQIELNIWGSYYAA